MSSRTLLYLLPLLPIASATSYTLSKTYDSTNFFTDFDFFADADPTHGSVSYQSEASANSLGLTKTVNAGAYIGVSNSTDGTSGDGSIPSVRLQSKDTYTKMLLVADIAHMPFACGAWPSLWTWADPWPGKGEIDIIEGVNSQSTNAMTLHTSDSCTMTAGEGASSTFVESSSGDCGAPSGSGSTGCQQQQSQGGNANYGAGFNAAGGGVYAMEWTSETISVWFFPRSSIPSGLGSGDSVDSSVLGTPLAQFVGGDGCDIDERFGDHKITIDTTFCGDWAGETSVWEADATCSAKASSCEDWMKSADPAEFDEVYWLFNSIKVYK
ncbi:unnamed protein product [Discula destructiva]